MHDLCRKSCDSGAPHEPRRIDPTGCSQAARRDDEIIEDGTQREGDHDVRDHLLYGSSRAFDHGVILHELSMLASHGDRPMPSLEIANILVHVISFAGNTPIDILRGNAKTLPGYWVSALC
jgi:hypothetical protein